MKRGGYERTVGGRAIVPLATKREIVRRFRKGESASVLMHEYQLSTRSLIRNWAKGIGMEEIPSQRGKRNKPEYTEEFRRKAVERWAAGEPGEKIAREMKCSAPAIYFWARKFGIRREDHLVRRRPDHPRLAEALRRARAGEPVAKIASDLFVASSTIYDWIRAAEGEPIEDSPGGTSIPAPPANPFAAPLPFPEHEQNGEILEPEREPVQVSMMAMSISGLPLKDKADPPTRPVRTYSKSSKPHAKPLVLRANCPHCGHEAPPPRPPEAGHFIATQFVCPACAGLIDLPD